MTDKFLAFLQWEETNATQYHAEELARDNSPAIAIPMTADYWRGYADAVANALAAYAGPTNLDELMPCPHSAVTESHLGEELTCLTCNEAIEN